MDDRTQVILVITGLGATAVETSLPPRKSLVEPVASSLPVEAPIPRSVTMPVRTPGLHDNQHPSMEIENHENKAHIEVSAATPADLDLPAFMRRRIRQVS